MKRNQNFVDGQLVDALSGEPETIPSPASEQAIASVPKAGAADVDRAVAAADKAFAGWSDQTPGARAAALLKLADRVESHGDELAALDRMGGERGVDAAARRHQVLMPPLATLLVSR